MVNIWVWRWESIFFQLARYFICVNLELTYKVIKSKCLLFVTMPKQECGFIQRLYAAIEEQRSSIVDWDPSGKGFIVGNLIQFTNQILLRKFGIGRLDSFARKLNRHGFKRSKIDKNKIRFFHKYFNRQSKNLSKIKKLSKYESLPKHIKLRMIRQQLIHKNGGSLARQSDIVNEIFETVKINEEEPDQDASDNKEEKMGQNQAYNENDESLNEDEAMIKIQQNHYIGLLRTPQSKYVELGSDNEETKRAINNKTLHYDDESQEASC